MDRVFIIPFTFSNKQQINREASNPHHYKELECRSTRSGASAGSSGEPAHIPADSSAAVADSPAAGILASGRADSLVRDSPAADSPDSAASAPGTFSLGNRSLCGASSCGRDCGCGSDCVRGRGLGCAQQSEIAIAIGCDCDCASDCGSDRGNSR